MKCMFATSGPPLELSALLLVLVLHNHAGRWHLFAHDGRGGLIRYKRSLSTPLLGLTGGGGWLNSK